MTTLRCPWAKSELDIQYHDKEWGKPLKDSQKLFELLILEGAQAGLSWSTILKRREGYRQAFDGFNPARMAKYTKKKIEQLMQDKRIIRNRLKIHSAISNAKAYLDIPDFSDFLWETVDHTPKINQWKTAKQVPASTPASDILSKKLKKAGFNFVGTTICYAFMQACGMVDDHLMTCSVRCLP